MLQEANSSLPVIVCTLLKTRQWVMLSVPRGILFLLILICSHQLQGQPADAMVIDPPTFKPVPGIPSESSITSIVQDHLGFLWFGTRNGLNRYDGLKFVVYEHSHQDSSSLSNGYVSSLFVDSRKNLWVGTWSGGLNLYDREHDTFSHFTHDPENPKSLSHPRVHAIYEDANHNLWIGTENGLNQYHPETGTFTRYFHNDNDPHSLAHSEIRRIFEDEQHNLWIGTYGGGVDRFDRKTKHFIHYQTDISNPASISSNYVRASFKDRDGDVWIGTRNGLNLLVAEGDDFKFKRFLHDLHDENSLAHDMVLSISQDNYGRLWVGTENGGLSIFDKEQGQFTNLLHNPLDHTSIQSNSIWSLYKDNVGTMWLGAYNSELVTWNRFQSKFHHYYVIPSKNSLSNNNVTCFVEDELGNLWIGTDGGGLNYLDRKTNLFTHYRHDPSDSRSLGSDAVISLMRDQDHNIWVGTWGGGLNRFNAETQSFTRYLHDDHDSTSIGSDNIFTMLIDSRGRFWVGAFYSGLDLFDQKSETFTHFKPNSCARNCISDHRVFKITEDSKQQLWIGTQGGGLNLLRESPEGKVSFSTYKNNPSDSTSLGGDIILSMVEDRNQVLWIGTYGDGLSRLNTETFTFKTYRKGDGLHNQVIDGILEDNGGNLWLSTNDGLSRFDSKQETFKKYDVSDGVQAKEFIRGSCYKTSEGELLFGGLNGYNAFYPYQVSENPFIPPVYITDFRMFNESVRPGSDAPLQENILQAKKLVLSHDQNVFSFEIAVLNYTQATKNQYAYKLEGYDNDWQYIGTRRNAYYTKVPPGHYIFRAKGTNNNGVWNEEGTAIILIIKPPWYQTWWAYALYLLALVLLFYWYRQDLIRRERLKSELQLEHLELTKMKELDHLKSNFFANIAHEFRTPLALIQGSLQALYSGNFKGNTNRQFRIMLRNSGKLLNLINQLLDLSRLGVGSVKLEAAKLDLVRFLNPIIASFNTHAQIQHINFFYDHPSEPVFAYFDPDKLEKVINNLLSNAFKFTPENGSITVFLHLLSEEEAKQTRDPNKSWVEIGVKDTGIGIPKELIENIFNRFYQINATDALDHQGSGIGLSLTRELVELHHGEISVESTVNQGSHFKIRLPLGHDHLNESEIVPAKTGEPESMDWAMLPPQEHTAAEHLDESKEDLQNDQKNPKLPLVLIVEDDEDFRTYIAEHLETHYRLEEAANGKDGFKIAVETLPDLIISDVMMREMNGLELCQKIKQDERTSHIPVILLTGKASVESEIEGLETGADYYIIKPFNSKLLELRVRNILKSRELFQQQLASDQSTELEPKKVTLIPADKKLLQDALAVIEQNMDNSEFTVEDFGRELGLSRMQLYRKLKAVTGQSASDFIRTIRLKRAAQLIEQNQLTIAEVTYSVGFNDLQYFRDCFKKQFGVTPSRYGKPSDFED